MVGRLLELKLQTVRNHLAGLDRQTVIRTGLVGGIMMGLWAVSFWLVTAAFEFLLSLPAIGPVMVQRTFALFFLTLFGMLIFSAMIISLRTVFRSQEVDQLVPLPIPSLAIFWAQTVEAIVYSAWPFVFLALPFLVGYGLATGAGTGYYVGIPLFLLPFVTICGFLGVLLCHLLVLLFPRLRRRLVLLLGLTLWAGLGLFFFRYFELDALKADNWELMAHRLATGLKAVQTPFAPSTWVSSGLLAAQQARFQDLPFYLCLLFSHALFVGLLLRSLAHRFFNRARADLLSVPPATRSLRPDGPLIRWWRRRNGRRRRSPWAALALKDLRLFLREPAQWSQLLLFLLLVGIYLISLRQAPDEYTSERWFHVAVVVNKASIALILGVLATRFVYPMLSLEGPGLWLIDLSPVSRRQLAWQKAAVATLWLAPFGLATALVAAWFLELPLQETLAGMGTSLILAITLVALATGLGALFPRFDEQDPARILNGLGGTVNFFASFIYLFVVLGVDAFATFAFAEATGYYPLALWGRVAVIALVSLLVARFVLRRGFDNLERLEL